VVTKVLRTSKGPTVTAGDQLGVFYSGKLSDGTIFDGNFNFNTFEAVSGRSLFSFQLGSGQVISGWDQGLLNHRLGEILELTIPAELAYGSTGAGSIPPNATLTFTVELVGKVAKGATTATYFSYANIGENLKTLGLTSQAQFDSITASKVGTDANDALIGGSNIDLLLGLKGNDILTGNAGADLLIGGVGGDTYRYLSVNDSLPTANSRDTIFGFAKSDRIDLSALDGNRLFIGTAAFGQVAGQVRFNQGLLQLDANGDGQSDFEILLQGTKTLSSSNLVL
jgi:hypothetical protein